MSAEGDLHVELERLPVVVPHGEVPHDGVGRTVDTVRAPATGAVLTLAFAFWHGVTRNRSPRTPTKDVRKRGGAKSHSMKRTNFFQSEKSSSGIFCRVTPCKPPIGGLNHSKGLPFAKTF